MCVCVCARDTDWHECVLTWCRAEACEDAREESKDVDENCMKIAELVLDYNQQMELKCTTLLEYVSIAVNLVGTKCVVDGYGNGARVCVRTTVFSSRVHVSV